MDTVQDKSLLLIKPWRMISASSLSKTGIFHYNHFNSSWIVVKIVIVIPFDLDRALQSKSTTVGDYRRGPEPDRQKAAGRGQCDDAEPHRQRNKWVLMKISDASFLPRAPFPLAPPFPDHVWVIISFSCGDTAFHPCPWSKLTFGELAIMVVAIGPLLIGLYCICIRNKQKLYCIREGALSS